MGATAKTMAKPLVIEDKGGGARWSYLADVSIQSAAEEGDCAPHDVEPRHGVTEQKPARGRDAAQPGAHYKRVVECCCGCRKSWYVYEMLGTTVCCVHNVWSGVKEY